MIQAYLGLLFSLSIIYSSVPVYTQTITNNTETQAISPAIQIKDYSSSFNHYKSYALPKISLEMEAREQARLKAEQEQKEREEKERAWQTYLANLEAQRKRASQLAQVNTQPASSGDFDKEAFIRERCNLLGCNAEQVIRVMYCESGGRSNATNRGGSGATGLFQFMPRTFVANAKRAGIPGASIWDARSQIIVATYMFANGGAHHWVCK